MASEELSSPSSTQRLKEEVARQERTVATLKSKGHVHTDAERHLNDLKNMLDHSK
jgi:hypothetical protein